MRLPLYIVVMVIGLAVSVAPASAQVAIIAHKDVPVPDQGIKKYQLRDFYMLEVQRWSNKVPVVVYDLNKKEVRKIFYKFLGTRYSKMSLHWWDRKISGDDPPLSLETEEEMLQQVASTPGAIGFISESKVSSDVKTLRVIPFKKQ